MTSNSITLLKQKFDEIKKNINTIELKQKEFFAHSFEDKPKTVERPYRQASASRFSENKPKDPYFHEDLLSKFHDLEIENQSLARKLDEKINENEDLKSKFRKRECMIITLQQENEQLKIKLENLNISVRKPQSCIRSSSSPAKKNRVAFSKELISVYPIDENAPIFKASPQVRGYGKYPLGGNYNRDNPFMRNRFSDKYINQDV